MYTMHAVSLSNLMDFSLSRNLLEICAKIFAKRNFAKIAQFSHDFRIFAKIEKCIFVSTLAATLCGHEASAVEHLSFIPFAYFTIVITYPIKPDVKIRVVGLKRKCILQFSRKCENHAKMG
jgi:hypothetical protein